LIIKILIGYLIIAMPVFIVVIALCKSAKKGDNGNELIFERINNVRF